MGIIERHPHRMSRRQGEVIDTVVDQLSPDIEQRGPSEIARPNELRLVQF